MSHLRGIPTALRERFGVPVVFYDGDVPMSLPEFGGMDTGFNYYYGADPGEYDLVVSNSRAARPAARARRAPRRGALLGGGPELFSRCRSRRSTTCSSTATATSSGASGCASSSASRRDACPDVDFALGGEDFQGDVGRARRSASIPFNAFNRAISARASPQRHAARARDRSRVVDGAAVRARDGGAAIVSNPHDGIETLVRAGTRAARRRGRRRGDRGVPRAARDPGALEELGAARASARSTSTRTRTARAGCSS
jgi:hypothetical protein